MAKMDRSKFDYKTVKNGKNSDEQIYVVTPRNLPRPVEEATAGMAKFVNYFATPRQFTRRAIAARPSQPRDRPAEEAEPTTPAARSSGVQPNLPAVLDVEENELGEEVEQDQEALRHVQELLEKHSKHDNKLARDAMVRLEVYKTRFENVYQACPATIGRNLGDTEFGEITDQDSLEIHSDDEAILESDVAGSPPKQLLSFATLSLGRKRLASTHVPRSRVLHAPTQLAPTSPSKDDAGSATLRKRSIMLPLQSQLRPAATLRPATEGGLGLERERRGSVTGAAELYLQQPDCNAIDTKRSNGSKGQGPSPRDNAAEFFDVESECDVESRPEMCRVKLQHIKQVHLNAQ